MGQTLWGLGHNPAGILTQGLNGLGTSMFPCPLKFKVKGFTASHPDLVTQVPFCPCAQSWAGLASAGQGLLASWSVAALEQACGAPGVRG